MQLFFSFFSNFVNLYEIDFSYNNITDDGICIFSTVINDLIDNISIIDISNNKLTDAFKNFLGDLGIPLNVRF